MNKFLIAGLVIAVVAIIGTLYYFLIYVPSQAGAALIEGMPCKKDLLPGKIVNGECVINAPKLETLPCGGKLNPC